MVQEMTESENRIANAVAERIALQIMPAMLRLLPAELERVVMALHSPYRNRTGAAAYLQQKLSTVDVLMAEGRVTPKYNNSTPLILVSELDRVIAEDSKKPRRRTKPAKKPAEV